MSSLSAGCPALSTARERVDINLLLPYLSGNPEEGNDACCIPRAESSRISSLSQMNVRYGQINGGLMKRNDFILRLMALTLSLIIPWNYHSNNFSDSCPRPDTSRIYRKRETPIFQGDFPVKKNYVQEECKRTESQNEETQLADGKI